MTGSAWTRAAFLARALPLAAALLVAAPARAHDGESHGAPAPPVATAAGLEHAASGETEMFSVVMKYPAAAAAREPLQARIYVAHADTSAPIAGASVRLELKGGAALDAEAHKTDLAGVYSISFPAPPDGSAANGVVSVQAGDHFDLVLIGDLHFGPRAPEIAPLPAREGGVPAWAMLAGAAAIAGLTGALGFALGRRSRRGTPGREHDHPDLPEAAP